MYNNSKGYKVAVNGIEFTKNNIDKTNDFILDGSIANIGKIDNEGYVNVAILNGGWRYARITSSYFQAEVILPVETLNSIIGKEKVNNVTFDLDENTKILREAINKIIKENNLDYTVASSNEFFSKDSDIFKEI